IIPGNATLVGIQSLATAGNTGSPVAATVVTATSASLTPPFLGASVSGRLTSTTQTATVDSDLIGDVFIGSPGLTSTGSLAGAAYALQGALVPLSPPPNKAITTPIGV